LRFTRTITLPGCSPFTQPQTVAAYKGEKIGSGDHQVPIGESFDDGDEGAMMLFAWMRSRCALAA
jgi:hypothetical protein